MTDYKYRKKKTRKKRGGDVIQQLYQRMKNNNVNIQIQGKAINLLYRKFNDLHNRMLKIENLYPAGTSGGRRKKKTRRKPIRINPKMRGVFTKKAKRKGMSVQKYAKYIVKKYKGKKKTKRQLKLFRQALFAKTAKKWKKKKRRKRTRKKR